MAYADLTPEQRQHVDEFMVLLRHWCSDFAKLHNRGAAVNTQYWATVNAILSTLQGSDVIPNKTGYAGASDVTKDEVGTILAWIGSVATNNSEPNRQLMAKATGAINLVG